MLPVSHNTLRYVWRETYSIEIFSRSLGSEAGASDSWHGQGVFFEYGMFVTGFGERGGDKKRGNWDFGSG
jgi:hypothetical protein